MADVLSAVRAHLLADATFLALIDSDENRVGPIIDEKADVTVYPMIALDGSLGGSEGGASLHSQRLNCVVKSKTRQKALGVHDRLWQLFHGRAGITIDAAGAALYCIDARRVGGVIEDYADQAWYLEAYYDFTVDKPRSI